MNSLARLWRVFCGRPHGCVANGVCGLLLVLGTSGLSAAGFTRLVPLPAPHIVAASEAAPGPYLISNLIDGDSATEYASAEQGLTTYAEFDFGATVPLAAFRHRENASFGVVAASELVCFDEQGRETARVPITHLGRNGAVTFHTIQPAVPVRRVRWQVTKLGDAQAPNVGAAELTFFRPGGVEPSPAGITLDVIALPVADRAPDGSRQPLKLTLDYPYAEPCEVTVQMGTTEPKRVRLMAGAQTLEWAMPISKRDQKLPVTVADAQQRVLLRHEFSVPAFRELTIYIVPHSHVDIGYTEIQTDIEEKQMNNILAGIDAAERTASYPEGARFVWNLENLWPADMFLRRLGPERRDLFIHAVKARQIALNGLYFNVLTGLCRPEELIRAFRFAPELRAMTGVPLDSAMISDVPGYTWGTVPALVQAGIRYFSVAPNYCDRIGGSLVEWENKPFWWIGPSGRDRVLVWVPSRGYYLYKLIGGKISPEWVSSYVEALTSKGFPYDVSYLRWSCGGDNSAPDTAVCDQVKAWNETHAWPRLVIGSVHDAFQRLDQKYGAQLPEVRGDWSPYWEDGAGSSASETAMNRASSDRLAQAEALWAMLQPRSYPTRDFTDAMRHVLLYDEHTWGAARSVVEPNYRNTLEQWPIKRSYAVSADAASRDLLGRALALTNSGETTKASFDLYNTSSWTRSGLVRLPKDFAAAGDRVTDDHGQPVPSQRNVYGELVLFARDVPAFGARRYAVSAGAPHVQEKKAVVHGTTLDNGRIKVRLDPQTGDIVELRVNGGGTNFAENATGEALNRYLYFTNDDATKAVSSGPARIRVKENGPLVASLVVESSAPGCYSVVREVRLVAGEDRVEIENLVDKQRIPGVNYQAPGSKESVNFAFPFNVPGGQARIDVPFGIVRPDTDQIPGSCKNWLVVNRWADFSRGDDGITWISLDAPLVQLGGLTANLLNSQANPAVWRKQIGPTQKLYAWVMNNHWGTNYRAYQEGPQTFRFVLQPHGAYDPAAASRAAIEASQPLLPMRAFGAAPQGSRLQLTSGDVLVIGIKPSDDGRAVVVRLWNATEKEATTRLQWSDPAPRRVSISDTSEQPMSDATESISLPAHGIVTLRADLL